MVRFSSGVAAVLVVALAGCGTKDNSPPDPTLVSPSSSAPAATEEPGRPPIAFAACSSCHAVTPGQNGIGPSLAGVFGRKAGSDPSFVYSEAMKTSGKVWDEATLDAWLSNPMGMVPGTKMTYMGQSDPAKRAATIAYLKTQK